MNTSLYNVGMSQFYIRTSHPTSRLVQLVGSLTVCLFTEKKKKRKRSQQKKTKIRTFPATELKQTTPPRVTVSTLFPSGYPAGELAPYENTSRTTERVSLQFTSLGRRLSRRLSPGCGDPSSGSPICPKRAHQARSESSINRRGYRRWSSRPVWPSGTRNGRWSESGHGVPHWAMLE